MKITNELLAVYAEGNATEAERIAVRQYLTDNPEKLDIVLMMMDEDYKLDILDDEAEDDETIPAGTEGSFSDICYSAAAFAPRIVPLKNDGVPEIVNQGIVRRRLGDLLDELDLLDL